jgi:hypothetical protein
MVLEYNKQEKIKERQCCGSGMFSRIRIFHPGSRIRYRVKKIPDPGSVLKNLSTLTLKTVSKLSENDMACSSRTPDMDFWIPDPDPQQ